MKFDNKISIDGVAVIGAAVGVIIWLNTLSNTVKQNTADIKSVKQEQAQQAQTQNSLAQTVAQLTALQTKTVKDP